MHIGLIGGIGPAATVVYYNRIVAAFRAANQPLELTIVHADVQTLVKNAQADDRAGQAQVYARHLAQLQGAGADFGTITSLGGSFCFAEAEALSPIPLISAIAPVDAALAQAGVRIVGLLGTRQVMGSALYGELHSATALAPTDIDAVHDAYLDMATKGHCSDQARAVVFAAGAEMMQRGADAILLAGTDLGLAFDGQDAGFPVVDALDIHVDHLVNIALR